MPSQPPPEEPEVSQGSPTVLRSPGLQDLGLSSSQLSEEDCLAQGLGLISHFGRRCLVTEKSRTPSIAFGEAPPLRGLQSGSTITVMEALKFSSSFSVFSSVRLRSLSAWLILDSRV